jgi:hypothetical protein
MQTGLSLVQLAQQIEANKNLKHDMIAPASALEMTADTDGVVALHIADQGKFPLLETAHDQIGARLSIPAKYYDRMRKDAPDLLATNVNRWFREQPKDKRLIRTLGGDARAFLSNRYQRIDNEEIAEVVLPILAAIPDVRIVSSQITDRRLYIQAVSPRVQGEVALNDVVQAGVTISNSEIGYGSVTVAPLVYRLRCLNGMILPDQRFRAYHVGRQIEDNTALWADDTRKADDRAVLLKVRDMVAGAVDAVRFAASVEKMAGLTSIKIAGDPVSAVEVLSKKIGATDDEAGGIIRSLVEGGDLSAWGMLNAITHQAHTVKSYDRAVEFEAMGGALLNLTRSEWKEVLEAV